MARRSRVRWNRSPVAVFLMILVALLLLLGFYNLVVCRLQRACGGSAAATLKAERADIRYRARDSENDEPVAADDERDIFSGDRINAQEHGRAVINFPDALRVVIYRNSNVDLVALGEPDPSAPPAARQPGRSRTDACRGFDGLGGY